MYKFPGDGRRIMAIGHMDRLYVKYPLSRFTSFLIYEIISK